MFHKLDILTSLQLFTSLHFVRRWIIYKLLKIYELHEISHSRLEHIQKETQASKVLVNVVLIQFCCDFPNLHLFLSRASILLI